MFDSLSNPIDEQALAHTRLAHLRQHLATAGIDVAVLTNPVSIRYATGYRGYAAFQSRIPSQYLILPVEGPVILHGAYTSDSSTIDHCRTAHSLATFDAGLTLDVALGHFVDDLNQALGEAGLTNNALVGFERLTPQSTGRLTQHFSLTDIEGTVELARSRKVPGEMDAMRHSIAVAELAMARMRNALAPGVTENALIAELHRTNIEHDGDWIDGRMLCSGPRTNPWYQEASARAIESGDLVAFDTDMIGPNGYCADISRTWVCETEPTSTQRELHARAQHEIEHNMTLLHVGASFAEISQRSFRQPDEFIANRYACVMHGVGMSDEYPKIAYPQDWHWTGYDGEIEEGVVLSVESYVGADGAREGIKLEQMVQVTHAGVELLSVFPTGLTVNG